MKLLKITRNDFEEFDPLFEEVETVNVEQVAPSVIDGETDVKINGGSISDYDAVFTDIPQKNAVFGRVLLEMIEEEGIRTNHPSTAFFIMSKKNYLHHVLHQKDIDASATVVVASDKAGRNIEDHLETPLIARKFDQLVEVESRLIEDEDTIEEFVGGTEYPDEFIVFQELEDGDKYRCLYAGGEIISLMDSSDSWQLQDEKLKYSSLSQEQKKTVEKAAKNIGTPVAEVVLRGGKVFDVNPNPDLGQYTEVSGKNAYEAVAQVLKGDIG